MNRNRKITILIDVDDVINNLCQAWIAWLNNEYKTNVKYEDITEWNMCKAFPELTRDQVYKPTKEEAFWKTVTPRFDAMKYIELLHREGFNLYFCTSTHYKNIEHKFELIVQKYFPCIDWNHVIVIGNKQLLHADYMIDDAPHNLLDGEYKRILFNASHNREFDAEANSMIRVSNWEEIYNLIHDDLNSNVIYVETQKDVIPITEDSVIKPDESNNALLVIEETGTETAKEQNGS